jgi:hypothetical protein
VPRSRVLLLWAAWLGAVASAACGEDNAELVGNAGGNSGSAGLAGTAGGSAGAAFGSCQGHVYACGDGVDNDGDGKIDALDPDCLGACDNTEDSYFGGIPGQNNAPCKMDCYFDQDTGPGNDDCYWNHACDPLSVSPDYPPEGLDSTGKPYCPYDPNAKTPGTSQSCDQMMNQQSQQCAAYCGPLTPNGCDCFGCCELPAESGSFVWIGSTIDGAGSCDAASLADPARCKPCTPVSSCLNSCEHCELCLGKDALPADCEPDGGTGRCPPAVNPCGLPEDAPCPSAYYCVTGCCIPTPPS